MHVYALLAQGVTLAVAFVARFLFVSRVVYRPAPAGAGRRHAARPWGRRVIVLSVVLVARRPRPARRGGHHPLVADARLVCRRWSYEAVGFPKLAKARSSFSLIVPCREETEEVMRSTVERLLAQDHPDFEVIFSVGHDDAKPMSNGLNTVQIAEKLARRWPTRVKVSINYDAVKNKPRQLNTALRDCSKEIVGIIDAESLTQPGLLMHVDATFRETDADVVQGAVHLMNYRDSWFSLRNCMEYRIWFRSRLHGHALSGFIPLGGNTVFIKRALIEQVGGWDGDCLAEDCEIGVRLSCLGKKIVVGYDSALTTQEETPERDPAADQAADPLGAGVHAGAGEGRVEEAAHPDRSGSTPGGRSCSSTPWPSPGVVLPLADPDRPGRRACRRWSC